MSKVLISLFLFALVCITHAAINPPYFSQHDRRWGSKILGQGPKTISKKGCLLSTITSMVSHKGLKVSGQTPTPLLMNSFFKSKRFFRGTILFYKAPESLGFKYEGLVRSTSAIQKAMNAGKYVHLHVERGTHWVLATGLISGGYRVMDPGNVTHSYKYSGVVEAAIYSYSRSRTLAEEHEVDSEQPEYAESVDYSDNESDADDDADVYSDAETDAEDEAVAATNTHNDNEHSDASDNNDSEPQTTHLRGN